MHKENVRRTKGQKKARKRRRDQQRHRGAWTHCHGPNCDGSKACPCRDDTCGCAVLVAEAKKAGRAGRAEATVVGDFRRARARHISLQHRRDAIVALRAGNEVWVTVLDADTGKPVRCKVEPKPGELGRVLCLLGGTLRAAHIFEKGGLKAHFDGRAVRISIERIYGRIVEEYPQR